MGDREPSGRFVSRRSRGDDPGDVPAAPVAVVPEPAPEAPRAPAPARAGDGPIRVRWLADDVTPAAPAVSPPLPAGAGPTIDPALDVPAMRAAARLVNLAVAAAGLPPAPPARIDAVGEAAAPIVRRAATRLNLGDATAAVVPAWAIEAAELAGASWLAWGDALRAAWRRGRERAQEARDAANGQARGGGGTGGGAGGTDAAPAGWAPAPAADAVDDRALARDQPGVHPPPHSRPVAAVLRGRGLG